MKHKTIIIGFLFIFYLHSCSQNTTDEKKELYGTRNYINIDGILNESDWQNALFAEKFHPEGNSYNDTKAYLMYDAENLYVGIRCQVKDTSLLPKKRYDKDDERILENEWIAFCIDTYNDGIAGYAFIVDAFGNQLDGGLNTTRDLSFSFSSNWTSAVKNNKSDFTVEMKIPLAKLPVRWKKDSIEMAVQFIRNDKQNNRVAQIPASQNLSQFQKVVLHGINKTNPVNLSGVDIRERSDYKKSRIDVSTFMGRCMGGDASVMDYLIFKKRDIEGAEQPSSFHYELKEKYTEEIFEKTDYFRDLKTNIDFETLLERAQSSAFLVLQNDTVIYEKYFNGFTKDSIYTSFSMAKSFVSTLVGLAISDGYIKSEDDKITDYLPELKEKDIDFTNVKIKDLLAMSSGIKYSEDGFPADDDYTYVDPDLRNMALKNVSVSESPGSHWLYNNYNPILLGMILERTTGTSVSKYMEEKLWKKMSGEMASWSLDENGFEKMESGINCSIYDYARYASLLLNNGKYRDSQVIPEEWVLNATQPQDKPVGFYNYLLDKNVYYNYFWWGKYRGGIENIHDFFAMGNKGQYIYVCPQKNIIIIRLGFEYGFTPAPFTWPELFFQFATNCNSKNKNN